MASLITEWRGKEALLEGLRRRGAGAAEFVRRQMKLEMAKVADHARRSKFEGDPLNRRSGRLSRAIHGGATVEGSTVYGSIGVNIGEVPYAPVHEFGGLLDVREHFRRTGYNARMQRVRMLLKGGGVSSAAKAMSRGVVRAHQAHYPERAFLRPSIVEKQNEVMASLRDALVAYLRE